ncbi:MAG: hypothetical protein U5R30_02285 [Deltaproteobacteria bacterium]|nr:hypothetical protein [Deltaproteobacteria bacterium]
MKIVLYCQHIWGVGHYFRSLEICKAMIGHDVLMVTGGAEVNTPLPDHVRTFRLPALMTDRHYTGLFPAEGGRTLAEVKSERKRLLFDLLEREPPDAFLVELYPFGRRAFSFELDPVLDGIRTAKLRRCLVVCSLRDILVEKKDPVVYEETGGRHPQPSVRRPAGARRSRPDHSRPHFRAPRRTHHPRGLYRIHHAQPIADGRSRLRQRLGIDEDTTLIVASAGGGQAGIVLLEPLLKSLDLPSNPTVPFRALDVFTGPYMPSDESTLLRKRGEQQTSRSSASQRNSCRFYLRPICRSAWAATTPA